MRGGQSGLWKEQRGREIDFDAEKGRRDAM